MEIPPKKVIPINNEVEPTTMDNIPTESHETYEKTVTSSDTVNVEPANITTNNVEIEIIDQEIKSLTEEILIDDEEQNSDDEDSDDENEQYQ